MFYDKSSLRDNHPEICKTFVFFFSFFSRCYTENFIYKQM